MPIAFCWFGSYRCSRPFGDCNPPAEDNHPLASPGVGGIFPVRQSCWQAENLGRTAQAHWRDEPCKSPLGCAQTFTVNCSILFGIRTLPMARSSCGVCAPWAFGTSRLHPIAVAEPDSCRAGRESRRISLGPGLCPVGDSASSGPPSWGSAGMPSSFGCRE
jgi:hypothetical protein